MVAFGTPVFSSKPGHPETDPERRLRIGREMEIIAQAEAALEAGLGIDGDDLEKWLVALDHDANTPLPKPNGRKVRIR